MRNLFPWLICVLLLASCAQHYEIAGSSFLEAKGKSMLYRTLSVFEACESVTDIVLVVREDELDFAKNEADGIFTKLRRITVGGATRAKSAKNGFGSRCIRAPILVIEAPLLCTHMP